MFAFEGNGILDAFWEERQGDVLSAEFWSGFADCKGRILKALAFEAEFITLHPKMRVELWQQCNSYFSGNDVILNHLETPHAYV